MKLKIKDNFRIKQLKDEFQELFPYLKLEFFTHGHAEGEGSGLADLVPDSNKIRESRTIRKEGFLTLSPGMTVAELEDSFNEQFGLNAQVFRKSGPIWLETIVTDSWTLEEQNKEGEERTKFAFRSGTDEIPNYEDFQDWE